MDDNRNQTPNESEKPSSDCGDAEPVDARPALLRQLESELKRGIEASARIAEPLKNIDMATEGHDLKPVNSPTPDDVAAALIKILDSGMFWRANHDYLAKNVRVLLRERTRHLMQKRELRRRLSHLLGKVSEALGELDVEVDNI